MSTTTTTTTTTTESSRKLVEWIFAELAAGNRRAFADSLADDVIWRSSGTSPWTGPFVGKSAVLDTMLASVYRQLVDRVRLQVLRILADGDRVVVECKGTATTKTGKPYNNEYCMIYRIAGGKIAEITEYMDTHLAITTLEGPTAPAPSA